MYLYLELDQTTERRNICKIKSIILAISIQNDIPSYG